VASERVELARPFAVVDQSGYFTVHADEADARETVERYDELYPRLAPHTFVRLTAERVEEPIPEVVGPSGTRYRWRNGFVELQEREPYGHGWVALAGEMVALSRVDLTTVAALLRREGGE
jgi:hypothetical protein